MPTRLNSQVSPSPAFGCQMSARIGIRSPIFQPKRSARSRPATAPCRSASHAFICSGGKRELRIDGQVRFRLDGDLREEIGRVLVDAAEPGVVRDRGHARHGRDARLIGDRQRHDEADLVNQHQPIHARDLDAERERRPNRHQQSEQQERDEDAGEREDRAELPPPEVLPDERQVLHAAAPLVSEPLSRCSVRFARSAACGSCVTITIVLPCSRLSVCSRSRISSPALRSRSPVGSSQSSSVGIGDDGARDADALLLTAGELPRIVPRALGQAHDLQRDRRRACAARPSTSDVSSSGSSTLRSAVSTGSRL